MSATVDPVYDPTGPLPDNRVALEASAGTGKTHALAGLATRFLAETDLTTSELLVVTFTRAATGELRARVRDMLIDAVDYLGGGSAPPGGDELFEHLISTDRELRLGRLRRAVAEFDAATITTIHGFARQARALVGVTAAVDPEARLVDDTESLLDAACTDVLASASATVRGPIGLPSLNRLVKATGQAIRLPGIRLVPDPAELGVTDDDRLLLDLVRRSLAEVAARRSLQGTIGFDDLLDQLAEAVEGPRARAVVEALHARYRVALIDEFQDTDPVQWRIFSAIFGSAGSETTLVTVGDPKQAIFGFRGADVHTYLAAVGEGSGTGRRSLTVNWRSDGAVLDSLAALFDDAHFGDEQIPFVNVLPAPANSERRMHRSGHAVASFVIRPVTDPGIRRNPSGTLQADEVAHAVNRDLVDYLVDLLDSATVPAGDGEAGERQLRPSDIAVLVTTGGQGEEVLDALRKARIPAVLTSGRLNVLDSPAAEQLRLLLDAMARPSDTRRARAFATSWFVGWRAEDVATAAEPGARGGEELARWQDRLRRWSDMLAERSVADVFGAIWSETGVEANVLAGPDGDRHVTDLGHLVELLHGWAPNGLAAVAGLRAALDTRGVGTTDVDTEVAAELLQRRIESEDRAVQVMTVWMAKGLEFPVVCLPMLWRGGIGPKERAVVFFDRETGERTFDLTDGAPWPDRPAGQARRRLADRERSGQNLRALYVALTRAQHHVVVWWARGHESEKTALARILFARRDGRIDEELFRSEGLEVPDGDEVVKRLGEIAVRAKGSMEVVALSAPVAPRSWRPLGASSRPPALGVATLEAVPDRSTRRWSFSAITNEADAGSDPFDPTLADAGAGDEQGEEERADDERLPGAAGAGQIGPLASLPAGTGFGTLVHRILDGLDFTADDLRAEVAAAVDLELAVRPFDLEASELGGTDGRALLVDGLCDAIATPLGPSFGGARLCDVPPGERLCELLFDLRLGEGGRHAHLPAIGDLVASYLPDDDPMCEWALEAAAARNLELAGQLTGSIDLVLRIGGSAGPSRFVVADYKTNLLTPRGRTPAVGDYAPKALAAAMADHDYPLQALLYSVALHRYLRWSLPDYDPAAHLGGAAYLFVRGMTGADVAMHEGRPFGVFAWDLPPGLVVELSDLLDGRGGAAR